MNYTTLQKEGKGRRKEGEEGRKEQVGSKEGRKEGKIEGKRERGMDGSQQTEEKKEE